MTRDRGRSDKEQESQDTEAEGDGDNGAARSFKWPDVARLTFGPGPNVLLDARLDWVRNENDGGLEYYLSAYRAAVQVIYERAVSRQLVVEYAVIPLAFLWRHQVELLLKDVIAEARKLLCEASAPVKGHHLVKLWREAKPYIEPLGPRDAPELKNAEATIEDFQKIDPGADGFRYPHNLDGSQQSLQNAPDHVNIVVLHDAMEALTNFLRGVRNELSHRLSFFLEHEAEYGSSLSDEQRAEMRRNYMAGHR